VDERREEEPPCLATTTTTTVGATVQQKFLNKVYDHTAVKGLFMLIIGFFQKSTYSTTTGTGGYSILQRGFTQSYNNNQLNYHEDLLDINDLDN